MVVLVCFVFVGVVRESEKPTKHAQRDVKRERKKKSGSLVGEREVSRLSLFASLPASHCILHALTYERLALSAISAGCWRALGIGMDGT